MTYWPGHNFASALIRRLADSRVRAASTKRSSPSASTSPSTLRMQKGRRIQTPNGGLLPGGTVKRLSHQFGVLGILTPPPKAKGMLACKVGAIVNAPVIMAASPCISCHVVTESWVFLKGVGHRQNVLGQNGGRNQNERLPDSNCLSLVQ